MNIAKRKQGFINTSFEFKYTDENGAEQTETINYSIKRGAFDLNLQQEILDGQKEPQKLASAIAKMLEGWDMDWNGEPFPPNAENIARCDDGFLAAFATDLISKVRGGNPTKAKN